MPKLTHYTTIDVSEVPSKPKAWNVYDEDLVESINDIRFGEASSRSLYNYIVGIIERGLFDEAIRFTKQLIADGRPEYARCLADDLYDFQAPLANDAKWVECMLVLAESSGIYFMEVANDYYHQNECGEWIPGHRSPARYQAMMEDRQLIAIPLTLISHGYLKKLGEVWTYTGKPEPGTLPITTCIDPGVLADLECVTRPLFQHF